MTDQPTDHRAQAEQSLQLAAKQEIYDAEIAAFVNALIGIGHALLAQPPAMRMRIRDGQWETMQDQLADYTTDGTEEPA